MRQETRNTDSALQKTQGLLISGLCAVLEVCNVSDGDKKSKLAHAAVLLSTANREFNMKRRDLIRPDLNKQYGALCNPSTAISTYLFGDELNKEVEELTKSNKLGNKVTTKPRSDYHAEPYRMPFGRGACGQESPTEVSNDAIATLIANQPPFKAGGLKDCVHAWTEITSDPFILDAVTHCHLEFDSLPESNVSNTRPYFTFNETEQTVIDGEIEKFLQKGIIRHSVPESAEVLSPIFITPKKDGTSRVIFNLKALDQFVSYHHFKMDTLDTAIRLMRPGCFMTSIDLKDAYYSIPIALEHQKYLKFIWQDKLYCFTCLPMVSSFPGVEFGPLHYRHIEADKDCYLRMHQGNFDAEMSFSAGSLEEIHWWVNNIQLSTRKIYHTTPDITIYTDASGTGWGAKLENGGTTCGIWSPDETEKNINCLELLAIQLALFSLLCDRSSIHVRIMCDNTTAVTYINEMGGCRSVECNTIAQTIWSWAIAKGIWLSAAHIAGSANVDADQLSQNLNLNLEWMLALPTFQRIVSLFGQPDIDLFANVCKRSYKTGQPEFLCFRYGLPNHGSSQSVSQCSTDSQSNSPEPGSSHIGHSSSTSGSTEVYGMQVIQRSLCESDIPTDIINTIMHSWRDSTHKQYGNYINKWLQFCVQGLYDPLHPTIKCVLMFLHLLYNKGTSYFSLNTARSAISNLYFTSDMDSHHVPIGKHFLICRYLKGVFNEVKPVPKFY
ncbi:Poly P3 [Paramuricea clavata]|uniref:Poly P3 n=1 Tax=Paramuricea clavata TaxID=317549 RepID=A0A7D9EG66_PARCT|nr:Poly P3 [Paramuricea clavata]